MKEKGDFNRLAKHVSIYAVGNLMNRGGAFVLIPVYIRILHPSEFGTLELFYSISSMVTTFVSLGLAHATLRFYFEYEDPFDREALISTSLIASFAIGLSGVAVLSTCSPFVMRYLFAGKDLSTLLYIVLAGVVLDITSQVGFAFFRAKEYSIRFILVSGARLVTQVGVNLYAVIVLRKGIEGIIWGNFLAIAMENIIISWLVLRECRLRFHFRKLAELVRYSYPFLLSAAVGVVIANIDRIFLSSYYSLEDVGVYALALKFGMILSVFFLEPFQRGYGAFRFSIMKQENTAEVQAKVLVLLACGISMVGLVIGLFSKEVIALMGGHIYQEAALLVPPIMLSISIASIGYVFQTGILFQKKTQYMFYISSTSSVFSLVTTIIGIRMYGMYGAVVAQFLNVVVHVSLTDYFSQRVYRITFPYKRIVMVYLFLAGGLSTSYLTVALPFFSGLPIKALVILMFPVVLVRSGVLTRDEQAMIRDVIRSAWGRLGSLFLPAVGKST